MQTLHFTLKLSTHDFTLQTADCLLHTGLPQAAQLALHWGCHFMTRHTLKHITVQYSSVLSILVEGIAGKQWQLWASDPGAGLKRNTKHCLVSQVLL